MFTNAALIVLGLPFFQITEGFVSKPSILSRSNFHPSKTFISAEKTPEKNDHNAFDEFFGGYVRFGEGEIISNQLYPDKLRKKVSNFNISSFRNIFYKKYTNKILECSMTDSKSDNFPVYNYAADPGFSIFERIHAQETKRSIILASLVPSGKVLFSKTQILLMEAYLGKGEHLKEFSERCQITNDEAKHWLVETYDSESRPPLSFDEIIESHTNNEVPKAKIYDNSENIFDQVSRFQDG
ncbi:MAG: hypothetical protein AB8G05_09015 [Oligoflexales bacterium]